MRAIRWRALVACLLAVAVVSPGRADLAAGGEIRLDSEPTCMEGQPDLAALPGGGFVAVWQQWSIGEEPRVFARIFGEDGTPLGPDFQVSGGTGTSPEVAANAAGFFLVVWRDGTDRVRGRAYTSAGLLLGAEQAVAESAATGHAVAAIPNGFAVVTTHSDSVRLWRLGVQGGLQGGEQYLESPAYLAPAPYTFDSPSVAAFGPSGVVAGWALHFEAQQERTLLFGIATSPAVPMERLPAVAVPFDGNELTRPRPVVAANAAGRVLTLWDRGAGTLQGQVYGELRQRLGPVFTLPAPGAWEVAAPDAASTPAGDFLVAWQYLTTGETVAGWVASVDGSRSVLDEAAGQPAGEPLRVWTTAFTHEGPSLAVDTAGQAVVAWETSRGDHAELPSCMSLGLFARSVAPASDVLRLRDNRFEVRVGWTDHAGNTGQGHATRLTGDSGSFWFFGQENVELIVKVLDGQAVNGRFWVFYGSLSDVAFTVEVTDTFTGQTKTYQNPAGQMASRADTAAFPGTDPD